MEVVKDRLDVRASLFKILLKISVHVTGHGFNTVHPCKFNMVNEVMDNLLLLAISDPKDVAVLQTNDDRGVSAAFMVLSASMSNTGGAVNHLVTVNMDSL